MRLKRGYFDNLLKHFLFNLHSINETWRNVKETKDQECQTDEELVYNYAWQKYYYYFQSTSATSTVLTDKLKIYGNNGKGIEVKIFLWKFRKIRKIGKNKILKFSLKA